MSTDPVYLDNAATTPLRKEVQQHMIEMIQGPFGNPSSTHQYGRKTRSIVESARKFIANSLNCSTGEIFFTSGGTEADNAALLLPVRDLGIKRIITSSIEHHAVLHTAEHIAEKYNVKLELVKLREDGEVDLSHLEELLKEEVPTLVSLMHGNNEIGNLLDLKAAARLCKEYGALIHSDTVQTVGHYDLDLKEIPVDFITASAHKFYGPKGVGFLYVRSGLKVQALISGGAQERNMRGGTENIIGIAGMHKALETAMLNLDVEQAHILSLKKYFIDKLRENFPEVVFNGKSGSLTDSLYSVLSVGFPWMENDSMFMFNMDLHGIAVSGGSACSSGSLKGSHVINTLMPGADFPVARFSFGKDNTFKDLDRSITVLQELAAQKV